MTGLGTMAGEIEQPEVVFPKAIAILIPTLATVRSTASVRACLFVRPSESLWQLSMRPCSDLHVTSS